MSSENANPSVFQLKASLYTITTLHLLENDLVALDAQLNKLRQQAPKFLTSAPVIVDFQRLNLASATDFDFNGMHSLLKKQDLIIVGLRHVPDALQAGAKNAGFGILPNASASKTSGGAHSSELGAAKPLDAKTIEANKTAMTKQKTKGEASSVTSVSSRPSSDSTRVSATSSEEVSEAPSSSPTVIVTTPVRSGQQIYAKDADLIVTSVVSHGAEVIADGNIHIYGTLKGRALAGVRGNEQARIFCHGLSPELISIAGTYWLNDDVLSRMKGKKGAVQIFLKNDQLCLEELV